MRKKVLLVFMCRLKVSVFPYLWTVGEQTWEWLWLWRVHEDTERHGMQMTQWEQKAWVLVKGFATSLCI